MRNGYKKIEVYFPDTEYEAFLKKVRRTNLSISEFVRRMAAEQVIREAPHADVPLLIREVKRVGNNINQLLFLANSNKSNSHTNRCGWPHIYRPIFRRIVTPKRQFLGQVTQNRLWSIFISC